MKVRELLSNKNMYDLLVDISKNTEACVIHLITGERNRKLWNRCNKYSRICKNCLLDWMNEEV